MTDATLVWDERALLGEAPLWDEREQCLYWVDVDAYTLHTLWPASGERSSTTHDARISSVGLRETGGLVVAHDRSFSVLENGRLAPLAADVGPPGPRMNDGACDPAGRYWAGTVAPEAAPGTGVLYRLEPSGAAAPVVEGIGCSNGIDWSLDAGTMYYVDSLANGLDAFDYDAGTGALSNRRRIVEIPADEGLPDGLTVDSEGTIWLALWGGWAVRRYDPGGELLLEVKLPVSQVSSCSFGGRDLDTLYVTSARTGLEPAALAREPHAGSLFGLNAGVRGRPAFRFAG
jgi:sugar lactone lactonase YvrE